MEIDEQTNIEELMVEIADGNKKKGKLNKNNEKVASLDSGSQEAIKHQIAKKLQLMALASKKTSTKSVISGSSSKNLLKMTAQKTELEDNEETEDLKEAMGLKEYVLKKFNQLEPLILRGFSE